MISNKFKENIYKILIANNVNIKNIKNKNILNLMKEIDTENIENLDKNINITELQNLYFSELNSKDKLKKGIVYTEDFITNFMINNLDLLSLKEKKFLDPSCGCGIFLINLVIEAHKRISNLNMIKYIENCIYGIDLDKQAVYITKTIFDVLLIINNFDKEVINYNIINKDSLFINWENEFKTKFDYIIGNPPYVKLQNLEKEYVNDLKKEYTSISAGTFNLYYCFIEKSINYLKPKGKITYIIPNNWIYIKSGENLRNFLSTNKYLKELIDFRHNRLFKENMTYNCIIVMNKEDKQNFSFKEYNKMPLNELKLKLAINDKSQIAYKNIEGLNWKLVDKNKENNIKKIESFEFKLDKHIKTGIATLKDKLYIIDDIEGNYFVKYYKNQKFLIEKALVKKYIKASKINLEANIIFPYEKIGNKYIALKEEKCKIYYPMAYKYLTSIRNDLNTRSSKNLKIWYEYGKSQGINLIGKKLIYPQFKKDFSFHLIEEEILFSNGFCILENIIDFKILKVILESIIFKYYINYTSYTIDGGFYCLQKKYLKNFSIPQFNGYEIDFLLNCKSNKKAIDNFLIKKYDINFL